MGDQPTISIVAVITTAKEKVTGGGAPVFIVNSREELQEVSLYLGKILDSSTHEITPDTMVIVKR